MTQKAILSFPIICFFCLAPSYLFAAESVFVFVTSKRYDGNLGGVEGANKICQKHAEAAGLPGEYKAWISSSTEQAPAHTFNKSTKPYISTENELVANSWEDFTSAEHLAAITFDEKGLNVGYSTRVWTGTSTRGEDLGKENCNGWRSNNTNDSGWVGVVYRFWNSEWSEEMTTSCDEGRNLYCIQQ